MQAEKKQQRKEPHLEGLWFQSIYSNKVKKMAGGERKRERTLKEEVPPPPSLQRQQCWARGEWVGEEEWHGKQKSLEWKVGRSWRGGSMLWSSIEERRGVSDLSFSLHH